LHGFAWSQLDCLVVDAKEGVIHDDLRSPSLFGYHPKRVEHWVTPQEFGWQDEPESFLDKVKEFGLQELNILVDQLVGSLFQHLIQSLIYPG
jgi:hypothetical protein